MKKSKNTGITLIALVISIIVILILSGTSITMLTGDNSVLKQTGEAKEKTEKAKESELEKIDEMADIIDNTTKTGDYKHTIAYYKVLGGENVTVVSNSETTTLKDDYGNKVKIPKGFGIAKDSGTKVEEGIVIEDADNTRQTFGNQFVWVPVGKIKVSSSINSSGKIEIQLSRGNFDSSTGEFTAKQTQKEANYAATTSSNAVGTTTKYFEFKDDAESQSVAGKTYQNAKAKDLANFVESALGNKGYYIARYEAGINGTKDNYNLTTKTLTDGSVKPLSKSGLKVWNGIKQSDASNVSKSMYDSNSDKITSDLQNSYAWDTAIVFIQKCGNNGENSKKYSIQNGYSSISRSQVQSTGMNMLKYKPGGTEERENPILDTQCKICDMAGNIYELTTESTGGETLLGSSQYCISRGGAFYADNAYMSNRNISVLGSDSSSMGFRTILYF